MSKADSVEKIVLDYSRLLVAGYQSAFSNKGFTSERLALLKNKHKKVTIRILLIELAGGHYNTLKQDIRRISEAAERIEAEYRRLVSRDPNEQPFDAAREVVIRRSPEDHLKDKELPDEISSMGHILLNKGKRFTLRGIFGNFQGIKTMVEYFLVTYEFYLKYLLDGIDPILDQEIDVNEKISSIKNKIVEKFRPYLVLTSFESYHEYRKKLYGGFSFSDVKVELDRRMFILKQHLEEISRQIQKFEDEAPFPKPKKPHLFRTKRYERELEEWEIQIGGKRRRFEEYIMEYLDVYFSLRELEIQWAEIKAYLSELLGPNNPMSQIR